MRQLHTFFDVNQPKWLPIQCTGTQYVLLSLVCIFIPSKCRSTLMDFHSFIAINSLWNLQSREIPNTQLQAAIAYCRWNDGEDGGRCKAKMPIAQQRMPIWKMSVTQWIIRRRKKSSNKLNANCNENRFINRSLKKYDNAKIHWTFANGSIPMIICTLLQLSRIAGIVFWMIFSRIIFRLFAAIAIGIYGQANNMNGTPFHTNHTSAQRDEWSKAVDREQAVLMANSLCRTLRSRNGTIALVSSISSNDKKLER